MANPKTGSGTKPWEFEEYKDNQATIDAGANYNNLKTQKPVKPTLNP